MKTVLNWLKKNWKWIAAAVVAVGSAIAFGLRGIFLTDGESLNAIKKKIEKDAKRKREKTNQAEGRLNDEIEKEREIRAELDRKRERANRRRAEAHRAIDDCNGDPDCIDNAVRRFTGANGEQ